MNGPYARFMNWLWNMVVVSVLWLICCIPVVTIGAANTAAYYTMAKAVRRHVGTAAAEFFRSFRLNLGQASVLTLLQGGILALLIFECIYLFSDAGVPLAVLYLFYFLTAVAVTCSGYLWPCLSRFSKGSFALIKMALILTLRHITTSILLFLLLVALIVGIYLMPWGILVFPGLVFYLQTLLLDPVLLRYSPKPAEGDPEADKWYFQ